MNFLKILLDFFFENFFVTFKKEKKNFVKP